MQQQPTHDPRPPYQKAADALRAEMKAGKIKPGEVVPSYRELQERFGIANMTARSALRVLRDEGLIYTVQGRGTFRTDFTPLEWNTSPYGPADPPAPHSQEAGQAEQPSSRTWPPEDQAADAVTESLAAIRDQLRAMSAEMHGLRQEVADLREQVQRVEQKSAP